MSTRLEIGRRLEGRPTAAAALYLQRRPNASPAAVGAALSGATTKNVVSSSKTRRNDLLFTAP